MKLKRNKKQHINSRAFNALLELSDDFPIALPTVDKEGNQVSEGKGGIMLYGISN